MAFDGINKEFAVFNTGGWVVDEVERRSQIGAAVVLLDDALNTVSLRMYNEFENEDNYAVKVSHLKVEGQANPLAYHIASSVMPHEDPWREFSKRAAKAINFRADHLEKEIGEEQESHLV